MPLYAYADETIFTIDAEQNQKALGCGMLISKKGITSDVINEALEKLKADPDFDVKLDSRTIRRGYFHASDDSKNAHSHFCNVINKHVACILDFSYKDDVIEREANLLSFKEKILTRCLDGSTVNFFNSADEIFLTIEKRNGFNDVHAEKWLKNLYKLYEHSIYEIPSFKTFFPPDLSNLVRSDYFRDQFEQLGRGYGSHSDFFVGDSIQKTGIGYLFAMG